METHNNAPKLLNSEPSSKMRIQPDHEGPYPLIPLPPTTSSSTSFDDPHLFAQWFSTDLTLTHNTIIRALNSLWLSAPLLLNPHDESAFVGYALALVAMIRWHHDAQERILFPRLQLRLDMRGNMVQHLACEAPLRDFEMYVERVHDGEERLDGEKFLELRKAFAGSLVQHLHDEIETMAPKYLYSFSKKELVELAEALEEHKAGFRDSSTLYPFILTAHNREHAPHWPSVPSSVKWFANHVGFHIHRDYWKFAPYTITGDTQVYPHHASTS